MIQFGPLRLWWRWSPKFWYLGVYKCASGCIIADLGPFSFEFKRGWCDDVRKKGGVASDGVQS